MNRRARINAKIRPRRNKLEVKKRSNRAVRSRARSRHSSAHEKTIQEIAMHRSHLVVPRTRSRARQPLRKAGREARTIPTSTVMRKYTSRDRKSRISRSTHRCNRVRIRALICTKRMPIWAWRLTMMIAKTWTIHTTN